MVMMLVMVMILLLLLLLVMGGSGFSKWLYIYHLFIWVSCIFVTMGGVILLLLSDGATQWTLSMSSLYIAFFASVLMVFHLLEGEVSQEEKMAMLTSLLFLVGMALLFLV